MTGADTTIGHSNSQINLGTISAQHQIGDVSERPSQNPHEEQSATSDTSSQQSSNWKQKITDMFREKMAKITLNWEKWLRDVGKLLKFIAF